MEPLRDRELEVRLASFEPGDGLERVSAYTFALYVDGSDAQAGRVNIRAGTTEFIRLYAGHIGYAVEPAFRGVRRAERAVRLLLPFLRRLPLPEVWITCREDNQPSRRTCERLGAIYVNTVDVPPGNAMYARGDRRMCRFLLPVY